MLEVMVGAMLLMIALAGLVPFFISGLNQSSSVRFRSTAANIAREKMEEIRQLDYREITGVPFLEGRFGTTETVRDVVYIIDYGVLESSYDAGILKEVSVEVGWTAPPTVSPTKLTTMFHQQYVGPRISWMEVGEPTPVNDPLGSPFDCLQGLTYYVKCHIAENDWGLVYDNLNEAGMAPKDGVYAKLYLVDDAGTSTAVGDAGNDYKITNLVYEEVDGKVSDVYFRYPLDSSTLDDGYFEFRSWVFNQYDEPGNLWRLRLRVENGGPDAPEALWGYGQEDDESIHLYWTSGEDKDRDYYVIERQGRAYTDGVGWGLWGSWVSVDSHLDPEAVDLVDQGSIASAIDPWGTATKLRQYQYRIWAVDIEGQPGAACTMPLADWILLPAGTPVPTSSTTSSTTVTTESAYYTITINNTVNKIWNIEIKDEESNLVVSDEVQKSSVSETTTFSGLPAGVYYVRAWTEGFGERTGSFTLPDDLPDPVMSLY